VERSRLCVFDSYPEPRPKAARSIGCPRRGHTRLAYRSRELAATGANRVLAWRADEGRDDPIDSGGLDWHYLCDDESLRRYVVSENVSGWRAEEQC